MDSPRMSADNVTPKIGTKNMNNDTRLTGLYFIKRFHNVNPVADKNAKYTSIQTVVLVKVNGNQSPFKTAPTMNKPIDPMTIAQPVIGATG